MTRRQRAIVQLAQLHDVVSARDVASDLDVSERSAAASLERLAARGVLQRGWMPRRGLTVYRLVKR